MFRRMVQSESMAVHRSLIAVFSFALLAFAIGAEQVSQPVKSNEPKKGDATPQIELRGRVVCLPEEMHRLHQTDLSAGHEHLYGLRSTDGKYFTLLRTKYSEAIFSDKRVRERDLLLKGRLFPNSQIFEPMRLRSVRNGVVHELYYYCSICAIDMVAPQPCECCQGPTELVEKPIDAGERSRSP